MGNRSRPFDHHGIGRLAGKKRDNFHLHVSRHLTGTEKEGLRTRTRYPLVGEMMSSLGSKKRRVSIRGG